MQFPQLTEYVQAITNAADNFDKLSHLRPVMDSHGEPLRSVGGFAVVFKMEDEDTGRKYAIKCFHENQEGREQAYEAISQTLEKFKSPYLMNVIYLGKELFVDTEMSDVSEFPVLQMDWIEGETMESFITTHYRDRYAIRNLYEKFCDLAIWLRSKPFAHGDIKPDNIMIRTDGSLVLVDYDGMFVPILAGNLSPTIGTKAFSHPLRTSKDFDRHIDDFALASMSISLLAMSENTDLYKQFSAPDRLLFSYEDYKDFSNSEIYTKVKSLGGILPKLIDLFATCLKSSKNSEDLYNQIFDIQIKGPEIITFINSSGNTVYEGDEIVLSWSVNNASQLFIQGIDVSDKSVYKTKASISTNFELVALNGLKVSKQLLHIDVLPRVSIILKSNSLKLKRGKEKRIHLSWSVKNSSSALLRVGDTKKVIKPIGDMWIELENSTIVSIIAIGLDCVRTFDKTVHIKVFSESEVNFSADKVYTLPGVPVKLFWKISHAKEAVLEGHGNVSMVDSLVVIPEKDTCYTLKVTDAFSTKIHSLNIRMLPLPCVKNIIIPTPEIKRDLNIKVSLSCPKLTAKFPYINIMGVELKAPFTPNLMDLKFNQKITNRIGKQIKFWEDLKSVYSKCINKILGHERY